MTPAPGTIAGTLHLIPYFFAISLSAQVTVQLGQPRLVAEGPVTEHRWGRWQFPTLDAGAKGEMLLFVHVEPDSAASYGKVRKVYVSVDKGRTWREDADAARRAYGLRLPNGEWLRTDTVAATPIAEVKLPAQRAERVSYKTPFQLYLLRELPEKLRNIYFQRFAGQWTPENHPLNDPEALRYATGGLIPQIWWGDMKVLKDSSIVALTYPYYTPASPRRTPPRQVIVPPTTAARGRKRVTFSTRNRTAGATDLPNRLWKYYRTANCSVSFAPPMGTASGQCTVSGPPTRGVRGRRRSRLPKPVSCRGYCSCATGCWCYRPGGRASISASARITGGRGLQRRNCCRCPTARRSRRIPADTRRCCRWVRTGFSLPTRGSRRPRGVSPSMCARCVCARRSRWIRLPLGSNRFGLIPIETRTFPP